MSLYPSLEDMKVDQILKSQAEAAYGNASAPPMSNTLRTSAHNPGTTIAYPALNEYMGLEFTDEILAVNMPEYLAHKSNSAVEQYRPDPNSMAMMAAPLSGDSVGLHRAQVTHGVREAQLCKGSDGKIGLRVKDIDKGVFVSLVKKDSPAALAGLRFGDQILQINGKNVAGMSMEKVHDKLKKCPENGILLALRDRPFERTVTLHKDSTNHIGFQFAEGAITSIVKDSSAARNGLLINHHLLEVDGQNVVGLKDKQISEIIADAGQVVTITIMPSFIYKHIIKHMASSLITKLMDHSVFDF